MQTMLADSLEEGGTVVFDLDRFIEDCRKARAADESHMAVRELVARACGEPQLVVASLGEPQRGGIQKLYHAPDLTVINVVWGPRMTLRPHNHEMWAVIGIYGGREDNVFWRRLPDSEEGRIEAAGAKALSTGDAVPLGRDIIHSVTNPISKLTGAIHVYGGDFYGASRSEWDPESLREVPYDMEETLRLFEDSNLLLDRVAQ